MAVKSQIKAFRNLSQEPRMPLEEESGEQFPPTSQEFQKWILFERYNLTISIKTGYLGHSVNTAKKKKLLCILTDCMFLRLHMCFFLNRMKDEKPWLLTMKGNFSVWSFLFLSTQSGKCSFNKPDDGVRTVFLFLNFIPRESYPFDAERSLLFITLLCVCVWGRAWCVCTQS